MIDLLRLHVVWDHRSAEGARIAERISRHFDGIGMERDGVAYRVPVRFASVPWSDGTDMPRTVDLTRARHNAILLLQDEEMYDRRHAWSVWAAEVRAAITARDAQDIYVPFGCLTGEPPLQADIVDKIQYQRRVGWAGMPDDEARDRRLLLV